MKTLRACWRLGRVLGHAVGGLMTLVLVFPRASSTQREAHVQRWAQGLVRLLGMRLQFRGQPVVTGPALIVSNHMSWVDILALHAGRHCRFISKADVRHWPLIGRLATGAGTLYIERESRRDALRVVHHMADSLRAGEVLAVFPEGTTTDGAAMLPFHGNLLQAAIAADAPVQPVALGFVHAVTQQRSSVPCYVGEDTLVSSLWRILTSEEVVIVVHYGVVQSCEGRDRRAWAADLHAAVQALRNTIHD